MILDSNGGFVKTNSKKVQPNFLYRESQIDPTMVQAQSSKAEAIILQHGRRGMETIAACLTPGYCQRSARLILRQKGVVLIGTGFPVMNSFETDGPLGAISLYEVLQCLGYRPIFVCGPPLSGILSSNFEVYELPIASWKISLPLVRAALKILDPVLLISVERPGVASDGRYYNMRGQDITDYAAKYDLFFVNAACPSVAFGDGGNEIGMGNVLDHLKGLPIIPSVTTCSELVVATVSNWGVYGVIAMMGQLLNRDLLGGFNPRQIMTFLLENGSIDGITKRAEPSEDGFPLKIGLKILSRLKKLTN